MGRYLNITKKVSDEIFTSINKEYIGSLKHRCEDCGEEWVVDTYQNRDMNKFGYSIKSRNNVSSGKDYKCWNCDSCNIKITDYVAKEK